MIKEADRMGGKILRVQMLGKFTMRYGEDHILFHKTGNAKSVRLLQMLLLSGEQGIAKSEIMDFLYGWSEGTDAGNRNKNLNNLCYRLKGQLAASGLPEEEYVVIQDGVCRWKSSFKIELDAAYFETLVHKAEGSRGRERAALFLQANQSYYGELLPMNQSDMWFYEKSESFKRLYIETIRELEQAFKSNHDYQNLLKLYTRASAIYPFENWQTEQIRCCLEMYRYEEAINIYNRTMELYAREMGNPPMEEMQKCFEDLELFERKHKRSVQAWHITDRYFMGREGDITRAIFEKGNITGAYYCTYPSFVDYCRLLLRARERHDLKPVLMFLTLGQQGKRRGQDNRIYQMELLKDAIGSSLRKGDAYTRYGSRHYILLLTKINKESCSIIFQRIESAYNKVPGSRGELWYHVTMTQELEKTMLE